LLGARSVVGLGEAAYGTVGAALLASLFPMRMRSTVLGAFLAAAMMGSVLGVMLGGFIADRWGWQAGFGAVGIPGLFLCFAFLASSDYKTVALPRKGDRGTCSRVGLLRRARRSSLAWARDSTARRLRPTPGFRAISTLLRSCTCSGRRQDSSGRGGQASAPCSGAWSPTD
jgi:MFS family permease